MSYDIRLEIDTGGEEMARVTETRSPTYNLSEMFEAALGQPISSLRGMSASKCAPIVRRAVERMKERPDVYRAYNPPNGWGSYEGAVESLSWLLEQCEAHPKATVHI